MTLKNEEKQKELLLKEVEELQKQALEKPDKYYKER